jgi:hypothetical protein
MTTLHLQQSSTFKSDRRYQNQSKIQQNPKMIHKRIFTTYTRAESNLEKAKATLHEAAPQGRHRMRPLLKYNLLLLFRTNRVSIL